MAHPSSPQFAKPPPTSLPLLFRVPLLFLVPLLLYPPSLSLIVRLNVLLSAISCSPVRILEHAASYITTSVKSI